MSDAGRRFGGPGIRRSVRVEDLGGTAAATTTLEQQIIAAATAGSLTAGGIFLARSESDMTLVGSKASVWTNYGTGGDATQGTDAARPTWSSGGLNSKGGLAFDGGDALITAAIDSGSATAYALVMLFKDTDATAKFNCSFGDIVSTGIAMKTTGAGVGAQAIAGASTSRAESAGTISMASHGVVSATLDTTLVTAETEVRHDGSNVTASRPTDGNPTGSLGSQPITIGARQGPANNMAGTVGAMVLLWGTGAWSGAQLTALSNIEALLAAEWA